MNDVSLAVMLAASLHSGQVDKGGEPYILHPLRVMLAVPAECRIAAVIHDLVEDTSYTLEDARADFGDDVANAVDALTRREGEDYFAYVRRAKANPIARQVKLVDLNDNMDPRRKPANDEGYALRMGKYVTARAMLLADDELQVAA